jgi:hypothetical protein
MSQAVTLDQHPIKWRKTSQNLVLVFSGLIAIALLGCQSAPPANQPSARAATPKLSSNIQTRFSKAKFGEQWPFTVDEVELDCIPITNEPSQGAVILRTSKGIYGINGKIRRKAQQAASSFLPLPPVITESGLKVCQQKNNS